MVKKSFCLVFVFYKNIIDILSLPEEILSDNGSIEVVGRVAADWLQSRGSFNKKGNYIAKYIAGTLSTLPISLVNGGRMEFYDIYDLSSDYYKILCFV